MYPYEYKIVNLYERNFNSMQSLASKRTHALQ